MKLIFQIRYIPRFYDVFDNLNNSFSDSLNDLLTVLSAVGNRNGQLCHGFRRPEDRPRAQVCIQACSKGQGRGHDEKGGFITNRLLVD